MTTLSLIFLAIIFVISISLHEYAHARTSFKLGDPTPKIQGRLTPNPLVHIDVLGFLLIFIIHFGWGKPVEVNPAYYKNTLRDELLVALAGPLMNLTLAILGSLFLVIYVKVFGAEVLFSYDPIVSFWQMFSAINIALAIFNMIPIYPLDGYRIIKYLAPRMGYWMEKNRKWMSLGLLALIFVPSWLGWGIDPIRDIIVNVSQVVQGLIQTMRTFVFF